jgi:hypothetical protein
VCSLMEPGKSNVYLWVLVRSKHCPKSLKAEDGEKLERRFIACGSAE